ncbi:esterase E4-like [Planococcus citri]|uniref:esterase E4-like n=1 Tax=Planococcus citri TaxID=170843 RepID=UPI0031F859D9
MSEKIIISVNEGQIRGFKSTSFYSGVEYYSFLGVPYGQSTAGNARFKDPVEVQPWNDIFDATTEKSGCLQFSLKKKRVTGSEDCLYNNIYTSQIPAKGSPLKAVIVNLHAGGLFHGSPDPHYYGSAEYVIHRDIVYVSVGFRLHILGHLNLGLEKCSGNQSLKDITLSLKWIKANISAFGGDPNNVTILGNSGGAAILHYLMLSPPAKGLYHKVVVMSGYAFNPALITPTEHISIAHKIALDLGYQGKIEDKESLLKFYRELPMEKLFDLRPEQFYKNKSLVIYPFSPFLPTYEPGENSTMPLRPDKLIPSINRVPVLFGCCEREGVMGLIRPMKESFKNFFTTALRQNAIGWGKDLTNDEIDIINDLIRSFYANGDSVQTAPLPIKCDILSDISYSDVYDSLLNVISAELPSSVFIYKFQYDGNLCVMKAKIQPNLDEPLQGSFHGADYSYWCNIEEFVTRDISAISTKDKEMIEMMTNLITTFAKTGNPNYEGIPVQWKPSTADDPCHLIINDTLELKNELLNGKRMEFWHNIKKHFKEE